MKIKIFNNRQVMGDFLAKKVSLMLQSDEQKYFCFPSGETPQPFFNSLALLPKSELAKIKIVALDEWVGIDKHIVGSCYSMLKMDFIDPLDIDEKQMVFFNAMASDLKTECQRIDTYLEEHPLDLALVGVGMNGHIGLNEPNCDYTGGSKVFDLDETTLEVAPKKYFKEPVKLSKGITLSLNQLANAKETIIVAFGTTKANIVKEFIANQSSNLPATFLANQANTVIYLDKESASLLDLAKLEVEYID